MRVRTRFLAEDLQWIQLSDRVGMIRQILKRPGKGGRRHRLVAIYFGYADLTQAQKAHWSISESTPLWRIAMRPAKRLKGWAYEIKIGAADGVENLAWIYARGQAS